MDLLLRLEFAYRRGLLVPFLGAGMSAGAAGTAGCPLWREFVLRLEKGAGGPAAPGRQTEATEWVQRAAGAVHRLRHQPAESALPRAVRRALATRRLKTPPQSIALARVEWPLVLTTNYDDLFLAAADRYRRATIPVLRLLDKEITASPMLLLGRSRMDCQRVLTSLRQVDEPILWALQGFVGGQSAELAIKDRRHKAKIKELERQLVVGHAEYRRVALAAEHFRRAMGEVFRSRSLLFLGSSLGDPYFLNLFDEIIELYGASPMEHFAVMKSGSCDPDFLRDSLGLTVHEIECHNELEGWLDDLVERVSREPAATMVWTHRAVPSSGLSFGPPSGGELRIVPGELPERPRKGEAIAYSAGGRKGKPKVGKALAGMLEERHGLRREDQELVRLDGRRTMVWRFPKPGLYTVNARIHPFQVDGALQCPSDVRERPVNERAKARNVGGRRRRDLRLIRPAVRELMDVARGDGLKRVHLMLLAAGKLRAFRRSYTLQEMVRGYADWLRHLPQGSKATDLVLHVTAPEVIVDLTGGRIGLGELFVLDDLRVWIEIVTRGGEIVRHARRLRAEDPVRAVLAELDITDPAWKIDLIPRPSLSWQPWQLPDLERWEVFAREKLGKRSKRAMLTVERLGVVPGSTLRVHQRSG